MYSKSPNCASKLEEEEEKQLREKSLEMMTILRQTFSGKGKI